MAKGRFRPRSSPVDFNFNFLRIMIPVIFVITVILVIAIGVLVTLACLYPESIGKYAGKILKGLEQALK